MYKKFALVVLVMAPILAMIASNFTPSKPLDTSSAPGMVPISENAPEQVPQPVVEMAQPVVEEGSNTTAAVDAASPGMPMLDPRGIDPTPVLLPGQEAPAPRVQDITPDAPPSISPHDRVDSDQPPGV